MNGVRARVAGLAVILLLTGCGGSGAASGGTSPTPSPTAYPTASPRPYSGPSGRGAYAGLQLSTDGLGPILLGLDATQGQEHGWVARLAGCDRWGSSPALLAEGVDLVFDSSDRLSEIWLGNPTHATVAGARVGMAVEEIAYLYGDQLRFERRPSVSGALTVPYVRDGDHELIFYAIGDEDATPGARAPVSGIAARAYGGAIERPRC